MVHSVCPVWSSAVKDSSAAFAFEGDRLLSSSSWTLPRFDLLMVVRSQAESDWQTDHMSTRGLHKTIPQNWQIRTTRKSTLHCSYQQESDNPQTWKCWITSTIASHWKSSSGRRSSVELRVLDQDILCWFDKLREIGFMLQNCNEKFNFIFIICKGWASTMMRKMFRFKCSATSCSAMWKIQVYHAF